MSPRPSPEDRVLLEALESGAPYERVAPANENGAGEEPAAEEVLGRLYTEVMGLIPYELDPVAPPAEVKERLMSRIHGTAVEGSDPPRPVPVEPDPRFAASRSRDESPGGSGTAVAQAPAPSRFRGLAAAAALVSLLLLAAVVVLGFQVVELRGELQARVDRVEGLSVERGDVVEALRTLSADNPGPIDVCPLRPTPGSPQPAASGNLVMVTEAGRWYLRARNLEPVGERAYVLWFLDADDRPLRRMVLEPGAERSVELAMEGIPSAMQAAAITIEPSADTAAPTGQRVLYGHRQEMERL